MKIDFDEIALKIAEGNKEQAEIFAYILRSKSHSWGTLAITFIVSYLLGVLPYALIVTYSIMLIRINSGGVHSKTLRTCSIASFLIINILALITNMIPTQDLLLYYSFFIIILGIYLITRYAPLDSPQRPIINPQFRKQLKIRSYIAFLIITTCFYSLYFLGYNNYSTAILLGLSWQCFTMTKLGYWVMNLIS